MYKQVVMKEKFVLSGKIRTGVYPVASTFTLIEMLVVIAIIGILASMLSPALVSAHNQAISIKCLGNQRNINVALQVNSTDNDNYILFPYNNNDEIGFGGKWTYMLMSMVLDDKRTPTQILASNDIKDTPFYCPGDSYRLENMQSSYGLNHNIQLKNPSGNNYAEGIVRRRYSNFIYSSQTQQVMDQGKYRGNFSTQSARGQAGALLNLGQRTIANAVTNYNESDFQMRHLNGENLNVGWMDGHCSSPVGGDLPLNTYNHRFWTGN